MPTSNEQQDPDESSNEKASSPAPSDELLPGLGSAKKSNDQARAKSKKPRSDKGRIMATSRDLATISWLAHQYAARLDQIQVMLSRFPDPANPFKAGDMIAMSTTKDQVDRWRAAGWCGYDRLLAKGPGYAWALKKGLELIELSDTYKQRKPAATRLNHIYAVNQVRFWIEARTKGPKLEWQSERSYRAEVKEGPYPDAVLSTSQGAKIAVEVELHIKKPHEIYKKLYALVDAGYEDEETFGTKPEFNLIWFYVPDQASKEAIEIEMAKLTQSDQKRISIAVEPDLISYGYSRE
jgi:hypothetical protein